MAQPRIRLTFGEQFTPKLVTVLREGYGLRDLGPDALAGLTVAIVALPLSMAIAIASGVAPQVGLISAIVGGFLVSALGGSRFQIGGPAGAFIVLVSACVTDVGPGGLILATITAGLMLIVAGLLRLGNYVKFIPYPVTVGFTAGIGVIILASQLRPMLGIELAGAEPGPFADKLAALWSARGTADLAALGVTVLTIAIILGLRRTRPSWPGYLIAIGVASAAVAAFGMDVATVGSQFGALPRGLPLPALPAITPDALAAALPWGLSFAILGAIESLLSAVVADGMSGRRHRSNAELVAQGVANIGAGLFGGMVVTGTIARTATNVRAGSRGPVSGMLHSVLLLAVLMVAAPLAGFIPLAALGGVLGIVAWNMFERHAAFALIRSARGEAAVMAVTFGLTVFRDLIEAIVVGFALGSVLFIQRMSEATIARSGLPFVERDEADEVKEYDPTLATDPEIRVFSVRGAMFFGAVASVSAVLERIADTAGALVIDVSEMALIDTSAANSLAGIARKCNGRGVVLAVAGADSQSRHLIQRIGADEHIQFYPTVDKARAALTASKALPS